MNAGVGSIWLFLCIGLAGSALPAHFGFRVLAYRQHLDRGYPFAAGTGDGGLAYSAWLMRWRHRPLHDASLNFFGATAAVSGWLGLVGCLGTIALIVR
jgi:hypothetical protein